ncbi:MAG: hypothetical protein II180_07705 [Proteobacteria bacterium]|nr:hypothetical protein [Pseudomonadota bacterium]
MSGFELDRQRIAEKLPVLGEQAGQQTESLNKALLNSLKQSSDIAKDLAALYADRPYVYARVMKQLGSVLGGAKVRRLHADVLARTKAMQSHAENKAKAGAKSSLRASQRGSSGGGAPVGAGVDVGSKKFKINVPVLGINNQEVELKNENGTSTIECAEWNSPILNFVKGSVNVKNSEVSEVMLEAGLKASFLKANDQSKAQIKLTHKNGKFIPSGSLQADLNIPDVEGLSVSFNVAQSGKNAKLSARVNGTAALFGHSLEATPEMQVELAETSSISGSLAVTNSVSDKAGGKAGGAEVEGGEKKSGGMLKKFISKIASFAGKPKGLPGMGAKDAPAPVTVTPMKFEGRIGVTSKDGEIDSITGDIKASNLGFLATPDDVVALSVAYENQALSASLTAPVNFKSTLLPDKKTTATLSIDDAMYTADGFCGSASVATKFGDILTAKGTASFEKNKLAGGSLTLSSGELKLPARNPLINGNVSGTVNFDEKGFTGASITGDATLKVSGTEYALSLDALDIDPAGSVTGKVSQASCNSIGMLSVEDFACDFSTRSGDDLIKQITGKLRINNPHLQTGEEGIGLKYGHGCLAAIGKVGFSQDGKEEFAKCDFEAQLMPDVFQATGTFALSKDYEVGSKLVIKSGAQATISMLNEEIEPIEFSGKYSYGVGAEGGKGKDKGDKEDAGGKGLKLEGELEKCVFNLDSGKVSGSASAHLLSDIKLEKGPVAVALLGKKRKSDTVLKIDFEDSELTNVSGKIVSEAGVKIKKKELKLEGYLTVSNYDVKENSFSGIVDVGLNKDLPIDERKILVLKGNKENGVKLNLEANEVTGIELDFSAELNPISKVFKDRPKFDCDAKNATIDPKTGDINAPSVSVRIKKDATLMLHEKDGKKQTELSFLKGSQIETAIEDSEPTFLKGDVKYTGKTTALKTVTPLEIKGNASINIDDVKAEKPNMNGEFELEVSKTCTIAAQKGKNADKIDLMKGTKLGLKVSEEGLDKVEGKFAIRYKHKKTKHLPKGFELELKGSRMSYDVPNAEFTGDIQIHNSKAIEIKLGEQKFTIETSPGMKAKIKKNELKSLTGVSKFHGDFKVGNAGTVNLVNGQADLDIDVSTFEVKKLDVNAEITCDMKFGEKLKINHTKGCRALCKIDKDGLSEAQFKGGLEMHYPLPKNDKFKVTILASGSKGLKYKREDGVSGEATIKCTKVKLGDAKHNDKKYEYGIAKTGVTAVLKSNELTNIKGSTGFYLEEKAKRGADALKVNGDLTVDYDCKTGLCDATGEITIEDKELKTLSGGDTLMLRKSTAMLNVEKNELKSVSGVVNLALRDGKTKKDYLAFKTEGEFDCIDTTSFTGDVSVTILQEKKLAGEDASFALYMTPAGESGIKTHIEDNQVTEMKGEIGFKTVYKEKPYFGGSVNGCYTAEDGAVSGDAKIKLLSDIGLPEESPIFAIKTGSGGSVHVEKNKLTELTGKIEVGIAPPGQKLGTGNEVILGAEGTVDIEHATIKEFKATARTEGEVKLFDGLSIKSLSGSACIHDNQLDNIKGSVEIEYAKGDFSITGHCENFEWRKAKDGGKDGFAFSGGLNIKAFGGKLEGDASVIYDALENPDAVPTVEGKLKYQVNEWLSGMIGVRFDGKSWDDPVVFGELDVTNATLIEGRQLFGFDSKDKSPKIEQTFMAGPVPITVGAGVGFGASIDMLPVTFDAKVQVEPFHIKSDKGIPKFSTELECKTGLSAKAFVSPYVKASVGVGSILEAGLKVRGVATVNANAEVGLNGKLEGGPDGLSGEIGLGFDLSTSLSLSIIPSVFATLLGMTAECDITSFDFDLGELFKFSWGKKFKFGSKGTTAEEDDSAKEKMDPQASVDASAEAKEDAGAEFAPSAPESSKEDAPKIPDAKTIGDEASKDQKTDQKSGGLMDTMEKAEKIGKALGNIGEAISFIQGLVTSAIAGGPIGVVIFLAIKILTGELNLAEIPNKIKEIKEGMQALKELITENADFIKSLLPDWLVKIIEFFESKPSLDTILNKVVTYVEEKINSLSAPLPRLLKPLVKFVKKEKEKIARIAKLFTSGSLGDVAKGILEVVGIGITSAIDFIKCVGEMWSIFVDIVKECVGSGDIYVKYKSGVFKKYYWQFRIPGLVNWSGSGYLLDMAAAKILLGLLGKLGLKEQKIS